MRRDPLALLTVVFPLTRAELNGVQAYLNSKLVLLMISQCSPSIKKGHLNDNLRDLSHWTPRGPLFPQKVPPPIYFSLTPGNFSHGHVGVDPS